MRCTRADSPAIRAVKDCAAAGVLLAVLGALAVGAAFLAHLLRRRLPERAPIVDFRYPAR